MANTVRLACDRRIISVPVGNILPTRKLGPGISRTEKYRRIAASIQEVGIIEPLVVYPQTSGTEQYILLDGHIRLEILKGMGQKKSIVSWRWMTKASPTITRSARYRRFKSTL